MITFPNPANKQFTLQIKTNDTRKMIMMQVVDENGRVIEQRNNIKAESVLNVGTLYRPGIYYIRILQGKEKRELKLIILSD